MKGATLAATGLALIVAAAFGALEPFAQSAYATDRVDPPAGGTVAAAGVNATRTVANPELEGFRSSSAS